VLRGVADAPAGLKSYLLVASALVFCPCHLPILAVVFAGSVLGSAISDHYGLLFPLLAAYFVGALFVGLRWMTQNKDQTCASCEATIEAPRHENGRLDS